MWPLLTETEPIEEREFRREPLSVEVELSEKEKDDRPSNEPVTLQDPPP